MAFSLNIPFRRDDIEHIEMLKPTSIYRLTSGNSKIVLKIEPFNPAHVKYANSVVKAIAPEARLKLLELSEISALHGFIAEFKSKRASHEYWGYEDWESTQAKAVFALEQHLKPDCKIVKMNNADCLDLGEALAALKPAGKADQDSFTAMLKASGGLERLGEIIAMDLFLGNPDRFYPPFNPGELHTNKVGDQTVKTKALVNIGNVFRVSHGNNQFQIGALDFLYNGGTFYNVDGKLAAQEEGEKWAGRILAKSSTRLSFAEDVVDDLETLLALRAKRRLISKLGFRPAHRVASGMLEGARKIKARLAFKFAAKTWPVGLKERYDIIAAA